VRCEEEGWGDVVLCELLSGSGYRLRAASKIGEFTRDSSLLSKFGISLFAWGGRSYDWLLSFVAPLGLASITTFMGWLFGWL
jgi:hypothetical protein